MKTVFVTGDHPRHAYIARRLAEAGLLEALVVEEREAFVPEPPTGLSSGLGKLFRHHFALRDEIEHAHFGEARWPETETLRTTTDGLNGEAVQKLLRRVDPTLLLSYGCHKLSPETLGCVSGERWNCHGGLSPWYRGAITHFWPSYMLEPQMTGMTVHDLTQKLDAGAVVHQCASDLVPGDGLHALAARSVLRLGEELPRVAERLGRDGALDKARQTSSGMLWLASKWRPEHLRLIYEVYEDRIVDAYLAGELTHGEPALHRQLE